MARTGLCLQYEVTALHSLGQGPWGLHRRAQGLSLPLQLQVSGKTKALRPFSKIAIINQRWGFRLC